MKYLIILLLLSSCSANWHLKRSEKHKMLAIAKGATVSRDTVFSDVEFFLPEDRIDTLVRVQTFRDTIRIEKDRIVWKIKVNEVEKEVFVQGTVKPDTIFIRVPTIITDKIKTGISVLTVVQWSIFSALLGALALLIFYFWKIRGKKEVQKSPQDLLNATKLQKPTPSKIDFKAH